MKLQAMGYPALYQPRQYASRVLSSRASFNQSYFKHDNNVQFAGWKGPVFALFLGVMSAFASGASIVGWHNYSSQPQVARVITAQSQFEKAQAKLADDLALYQYQHTNINQVIQQHGRTPGDYRSAQDGLHDDLGNNISSDQADHAKPVTDEQLQQDFQNYLQASEQAFAGANGSNLFSQYMQQANLNQDDINDINQLFSQVKGAGQLQYQLEGKYSYIYFEYSNAKLSDFKTISDQYIDILARHMPDTPDKAAKVQQVKQLVRDYLSKTDSVGGESSKYLIMALTAGILALLLLWGGTMSLSDEYGWGF